MVYFQPLFPPIQAVSPHVFPPLLWPWLLNNLFLWSSLQSWPLSSLCPGLLHSSFRALPIAGCSPAAWSCCSCASNSEGRAETQSTG